MRRRTKAVSRKIEYFFFYKFYASRSSAATAATLLGAVIREAMNKRYRNIIYNLIGRRICVCVYTYTQIKALII